MVIQHNLLALNANRQLGIVTNNLSKSTEKLSSGYKINCAADDAAGLSISEKMRKQIRGLSQASRNVEDGISLLQVADGALTEVHDMLQRMNELSIQAANGTNSNSDRNAINNEFQQLLTEIDRIVATTKFNEQKVFKGDVSSDISINSGISGNAPITSGYEYISYDSVDLVSGEEIYDCHLAHGYIGADFGSYKLSFIANNDYSNPGKLEDTIASLHLQKEAAYVMVTFRISGDKAYLDMRQTDLDDTPSSIGGLDYLHMSRDNVPPAQLTLAIGTYTINSDKSYTLDFGDYGHVTISREKGEDLSTAINKHAIVLSYASITKQGTVIPIDKYTQPTLSNGNVGESFNSGNYNNLSNVRTWWIQSGAEAGKGMFVHTGKLSRKVLNLGGVNISTEDNATKATNYISNAIEKISAQRSRIGAEQNRLECAQKIDDNIVESTQYAESQIRDTDMATEMVRSSNYNILLQVGQSMLAQANQSNQGVLSLIA